VKNWAGYNTPGAGYRFPSTVVLNHLLWPSFTHFVISSMLPLASRKQRNLSLNATATKARIHTCPSCGAHGNLVGFIHKCDDGQSNKQCYLNENQSETVELLSFREKKIGVLQKIII
jgi:hypothetical protein